jgi:RimJ/RimL family protein N-acetyltransferase
MPINAFDQTIGELVPDFKPGELPSFSSITGRYCVIEHLSAERHLEAIYSFYGPDSLSSQWTYLPMEALSSKEEVKQLLIQNEQSKDPYFLAILDKSTQRVVGTFALMRIDQQNRVIEVGWVIYSPTLKRSRIATEAQYLLMKYVFETLQYRRYEWKCDSLNKASMQAAKRLGFQFEGIFRRVAVYKGRNRDTAWFSMLEEEWQHMKPKFERWLAPENFDKNGQQLNSLNTISS